MHIDLSGRGGIELARPDEAAARYLRSVLAPFPAVDGPSPRPLVRLTPLAPAAAAASGAPGMSGAADLTELQRAADDDLVTGSDGEREYVIWDGRSASLPKRIDEAPAAFDYELGFPLWRIYRSAIRPSLQIALAARGEAVAVHAASVVVDGAAVAVAGWSESGKTETALALMERGANFLSDKWTLLGADGEASAFPISVGIRRWVLPYLPTLGGRVTGRSRLQFAAVRLASLVLDPIARRPARSRARGAVADLARRSEALGDRAAFEVDELRSAYGDHADPTRRVPTGAVVVLRTVPDGQPVRVEEIDPAMAAMRLARSAAYERRAYLGLLQRAAYADLERPASVVERAIELDTAVLGDALRGRPLFQVEAPFPTDPRPVAAAILAALR